MPRKAPDSVAEARITLGNLERQALSSIMQQQKVTNIINGVSSLAAGVGAGGVLLAAAALAAWKAPGVVSNAAGKASQAAQDALGIVIARDDAGRLTVEAGVGGLAGIGGILDIAGDAVAEDLISLRRQAQALARERGEIADEITTFCSVNASKYDAQKCNAAHDRKDAYFTRLKAFREQVAKQNETRQGIIYKGLGDIDPGYA